jgi:hypothetical protein
MRVRNANRTISFRYYSGAGDSTVTSTPIQGTGTALATMYAPEYTSEPDTGHEEHRNEKSR